MFRDSAFFFSKSSLSVPTPRYLKRGALKHVQSQISKQKSSTAPCKQGWKTAPTTFSSYSHDDHWSDAGFMLILTLVDPWSAIKKQFFIITDWLDWWTAALPLFRCSIIGRRRRGSAGWRRPGLLQMKRAWFPGGGGGGGGGAAWCCITVGRSGQPARGVATPSLRDGRRLHPSIDQMSLSCCRTPAGRPPSSLHPQSSRQTFILSFCSSPLSHRLLLLLLLLSRTVYMATGDCLQRATVNDFALSSPHSFDSALSPSRVRYVYIPRLYSVFSWK